MGILKFERLFEDFIKLKTKIVYVVSTQYMLVIRITFMYWNSDSPKKKESITSNLALTMLNSL